MLGRGNIHGSTKNPNLHCIHTWLHHGPAMLSRSQRCTDLPLTPSTRPPKSLLYGPRRHRFITTPAVQHLPYTFIHEQRSSHTANQSQSHKHEVTYTSILLGRYRRACGTHLRIIYNLTNRLSHVQFEIYMESYIILPRHCQSHEHPTIAPVHDTHRILYTTP